MNNPKINYTDKDIKAYLTSLYIDMIVKRDHPEIIKAARKLATKYMKKNK
jgi:hypothetical protein